MLNEIDQQNLVSSKLQVSINCLYIVSFHKLPLNCKLLCWALVLILQCKQHDQWSVNIARTPKLPHMFPLKIQDNYEVKTHALSVCTHH